MSGREELKVCGLAAVRARFEREPGTVLRLFFDEGTGRKLGAICRAMAAARKVYRCVAPEELAKVGGTRHHGGVVAVVAAPRLRVPGAKEVALWGREGRVVLLLDRVGNAHNLGAIVRTAAFFGVREVVIPADAAAALPGEAAHRVAEGGMEQVEVWRTPDLAGLIRALRGVGFEVLGAAARGGDPTCGAEGTGRGVGLVLGNEEHGLAPEVAAACSRLVTIPGSGRVESLNVSVAAAVLLWEWVGRRPLKGKALAEPPKAGRGRQ